MDGKQRRGENDDATRMPPSLMSAQGRETLPEVQCCDSGFDENLPPSKVMAFCFFFFLGGRTFAAELLLTILMCCCKLGAHLQCSHESLKPFVSPVVCFHSEHRLARLNASGVHRQRRVRFYSTAIHGQQAASRGERCYDTRPTSLMSAQGREALLEVECHDSCFDKNLSLSKVWSWCGAVWVLSRLDVGGKGKRECSKERSSWCGVVV